MSLNLLMDAHVPFEITARLQACGVDVVTAQQMSMDELPDPELLDYCLLHQRALFTHDRDFLLETARRQRHQLPFYVIFFAPFHPLKGQLYAQWLETYCKLEDPEAVRGRLIFIP